MDFTRITKVSKFCDPFQGFAEVEKKSEVRADPLTGHQARILDFPIKVLEKVDLKPIIEKSKSICPFCPEIVEKVTPKFSSQVVSKERYSRGEALCVPNAFPYDENSAVTVMTARHYVGLTEFTPAILEDALLCSVDYLNDLSEMQKDAVYQSINWNYFPLAGGSIIHPHLQIIASSTPTSYFTSVITSVERYMKETKRDLWEDFLDAEFRLKERFLSRSGGIFWGVAFAPMGAFDIIGILENVHRPSDIKREIMDSLVTGILDILHFIDSLNMYSFNMSMYFFTSNSLFLPHVRICPRLSLPPLDTCEINYMRMLHNETLTTLRPEDICSKIGDFWHAK